MTLPPTADPDRRWSASETTSIIVAEDPNNRFLTIAASPGPLPPGPYCQWQDRFSAASIREQVQKECDRSQSPTLAILATWAIAWNDDPQPLLVLRQLRDEAMIQSIAITAPSNDANCVVPLMRTGLIDAIITPWNLANQSAAAAILPTALEMGIDVIATDVLANLPEAEVTDDLRRHGLGDHYNAHDVAVQFANSHAAVGAIFVPLEAAEVCRESLAKADLPLALIQELRRYHNHEF